jgi:hypothetical protein
MTRSLVLSAIGIALLAYVFSANTAPLVEVRTISPLEKAALRVME